MDKNEIAALLESLCDRPFAADPQRPPVTDASAGESAPAPLRPEAPGAAAIQADDPGRAAADLASILSGTATPAQCQAFQEAAMTSSAVRLEAQSALAFLDRIEAAPLAAPAHLVAQSLASAGGAPSSGAAGNLVPPHAPAGPAGSGGLRRDAHGRRRVMVAALARRLDRRRRSGAAGHEPASGGSAQGHRAGARAGGVAGAIGSPAAGFTGRLGIFDPIGVASAFGRALVGATAVGSARGARLRAGARAAAIAAIAGAGAHRSVRAAQRRDIGFPTPLQGRSQGRQARAGPAPAKSRPCRSLIPVAASVSGGRGRSGPGPCREAGRQDRQVGSQRTCRRHLGARLRARRPRQAPSRERAGALRRLGCHRPRRRTTQ